MSVMPQFSMGQAPWLSSQLNRFFGSSFGQPVMTSPTWWAPQTSWTPWSGWGVPQQAPQPVPQSFAQPQSMAQQPAQANRPLVIAEIDQFTTQNGFNHGQEIARTLQSGGADPSLSGRIQVLPYNIAGGNTTYNIANALQDVIRRASAGQPIDAVNISQQSFENNAYSAQVRQYISQLSSMGIPVAIAAGNYGPQNYNQLAPPNAFIVQSTQNGVLNPDSGPGNVQSNSTSTSFATAALTPILASLKAAGLSLQQIFNRVTGRG